MPKRQKAILPAENGMLICLLDVRVQWVDFGNAHRDVLLKL